MNITFKIYFLVVCGILIANRCIIYLWFLLKIWVTVSFPPFTLVSNVLEQSGDLEYKAWFLAQSACNTHVDRSREKMNWPWSNYVSGYIPYYRWYKSTKKNSRYPKLLQNRRVNWFWIIERKKPCLHNLRENTACRPLLSTWFCR